MQKYRFKKIVCLICLIAAIGFGVAGFVVPPMGEIDGSVLVLIAQFLTASGTFIGLDVYFSRFLNILKSK